MTENQVKASAIKHYKQGRAKHDLGQYAAAIADYDTAIRLKPDYALAYYNLGNARAKLGHTWQAERSWQTALKLATQAGNVTLKNEIKSILPQSANQVKTSNSAEDTLSDISAEQREDFEIWRETIIEEQIAYYKGLDTLTEADQAFLDALETPYDNLTLDQQEDYAIWEETIIEEGIAYYQKQGALSEADQAFLDALQAYQTAGGDIDAGRTPTESAGTQSAGERTPGAGAGGSESQDSVSTTGTDVRGGQRSSTTEQDISGRSSVSGDVSSGAGQTDGNIRDDTETTDADMERSGGQVSAGQGRDTDGSERGTVRTDGGLDVVDDGSESGLDAYTPLKETHVGDVQLVTSKNLAAISAKQREDYEIWREVAVEKQVAYYQELDTLTEDQQAFLDALETPSDKRTPEQQEDYEIWEEVAVEKQVAYYQKLDTLTEDQQAFLDALLALRSNRRLIQEPLPQNNEEVNQQAKKLLQQIPEDELEYPIDPEQLYVLQLVIQGFENTSDQLGRIRSGDDELRKYWDKVELLVYILMDVSSKRAMNWLEENELVGSFDYKAQNDPDLAIYRVMESLMGYLMENGVSSRIIGDFGGLIESLSVDEVYTPIKEEYITGTPNDTKMTTSGPQVEVPDSATDYYNQAEARHHSGLYKLAIWNYDSAIRLKPNYELAYYNRGNAKAKLGQTSEAEQDWQTALKLATKTNNVKLKNEIESVLQRSADSQIKLDFEPDKEKVADHSEDRTKASGPQVHEKSVHYSEDQIKDIVADYFESLPTASPGYNVMREYVIQMGSDQRRADIVFLRNGKLGAIAECKETGRVGKGIQQLYSYLCATDTYLGIFANDGDPNKWTFWENHRDNNFLEIDRETFENYVHNHDKTIKDRENKIKEAVQREIDAEIRERIRKNTDTDAVRQNETDRIKREVIEDIDKKAIVNSVKSNIAQQAENGLLKERDKANRKLGREQGFLLTIFSLIGIGILIALLITSG